MPDRLTSLDLTFLKAESPATPMHVGTVDIFEPPVHGDDGFDYESLVALIRDRIAFVPRYRQRIQHVPGRFAGPIWVDDEDFDITFHVRRSALPRPGTHAQLLELVARIMSRRLDRAKPLWEMYLVEGLQGDRFAIIAKSHQALVDGNSTVDIGQVVLDATAHPRDTPTDTWQPAHPPSALELLAGVFADATRHPTAVLELARAEMASLTGSTSVREVLGDVVGSVVAQRHVQESSLHVKTSGQRRFTTVQTELEDYRAVRAMHGGTVNDVILAVVAGALRAWMMTRGESVSPARGVRAVVPVSIRDDDDEEPTSLGSRVIASTVNLPVGENSPVMRLHQISYQTKVHKDTGRAVSARSLVGIAGFAPTTLHALAARVATATVRPIDDVVITNVPGPQFPLYAQGAPMLASYPVVPLMPGQGLSVGVTSYDGKVSFGLNADRTAMPDLAVFAQCVTDALDELLDTTKGSRSRASRGRRTGAVGRGKQGKQQPRSTKKAGS
ncbi:wax ester/triacylglycerol synthase family O-acyltransferase [Streptomyces sp. SID13031]|uniref:WS/DGAT/MGAT family O-acyltransferase n=1 Tax=Streptomyces sp. SID13031 TaxID=2706046 RepID=UPI0019410DDA|nr:wax ester/triacylglycerol synthase family O-acyltransferase [Streptomyces sp. SID13031]